MHHLRESGALEQDADIVMVLHKTKDEVRQVHVDKARNGATGQVDKVIFVPERMLFGDEQPNF
jgi:replicative DNA helicase